MNSHAVTKRIRKIAVNSTHQRYDADDWKWEREY